MKNLYILPINKSSRLHTWINDKGLRATLYEKPQLENPNTAKNIYITSDEEIKLNDYITDGYKVWKWKDDSSLLGRKKVIFTTDQDLINEGVQAIDDEFLEWFVKNPSCEEVEVIPLRKSSGYYDEKEVWHWDFLAYKIIITKRKSKQETLEEAAEKFYPPKTKDLICSPKLVRDSFIAGAKWQKEQNKNLYSEQEVLEIIDLLFHRYASSFRIDAKEYFLQFKKK